MASSLFPFPTTINHHSHLRAPPPKCNCSATKTIDSKSFCSPSSSEINLRRSFPSKRNFWLARCLASSSSSEPTPEKDPPPASGVAPQDKLQIFFAVLFWMSLFFWSCAWDGGNTGKPNKGSRFRK